MPQQQQKASKPVQPIKADRKRNSGFTVALPETITLSDDERAMVARLIRVLRTRHYWLRYFLEWLLHMDATDGLDVSVEQAEQALTAMKNFEKWIDYLQSATKTNPAFSKYPGLQWVPWLAEKDPDDELKQLTNVSFSAREQLEAELREIRASLSSPRAIYSEAAGEYARRLGETLQRMKKENEDD